MAAKETVKKLLPPYVPYKTFGNFCDNLKAIGIPQRIDRSVMKSMSGGLQGQLILALEYLSLIADDGTPKDKLEHFVQAEGPQKQEALREILTSSYGFIFNDGLQLDRATASQFRERFEQTGATGDTLRKCMAFFLNAAKAAGMNLSSYIKKAPSSRTRLAKPKRKEPTIKPVPTEEAKTIHEYKQSQQPASDSWENILLSKFPSFDPAWPDEVKSKWFDDFKALMELKKRE
jgi:hypothetical protein